MQGDAFLPANLEGGQFWVLSRIDLSFQLLNLEIPTGNANVIQVDFQISIPVAAVVHELEKKEM